MVEKWKCDETLCDGLGWKYKMGLKTKGWGMMSKKKCEWSKTANEEQQQQQNKDQYHKNFRREPKQAPSLGVFDYFMVINDYLWLMKIIIYDYCDYLWLLIIICNYKMIIYGY